MRIGAVVVMVAVLAGCGGGAGGGPWVTWTRVDEFTDRRSCMANTEGGVKQGFARGLMGVYLYNYLFVETIDGDLRVGVRSGGRVKIPVGDVQIRIDGRKAWTISTSETPLDYLPKATREDVTRRVKAMGGDADRAKATYDAMMATMVKSMSPYTASTGEKARAILEEMKRGREVIYRTIGANRAGSTTGRAPLDGSFHKALARCGIE